MRWATWNRTNSRPWPNCGPGCSQPWASTTRIDKGTDMNQLTCEVCGRPVRLSEPNIMVRVEGWVLTRRGGGYNAVKGHTEIGRYRHKACHEHGDMAPLFR